MMKESKNRDRNRNLHNHSSQRKRETTWLMSRKKRVKRETMIKKKREESLMMMRRLLRGKKMLGFMVRNSTKTMKICKTTKTSMTKRSSRSLKRSSEMLNPSPKGLKIKRPESTKTIKTTLMNTLKTTLTISGKLNWKTKRSKLKLSPRPNSTTKSTGWKGRSSAKKTGR